MPKTLSGPFLAFLQSGQTLTLATLVKITRTDGTILGFTDHDQPITYGGVTFESADGCSMSAIAGEATSPSTSEVSGIITSGRITDEDLRAGKYNQAQILTMLCNWADLTMGVIILQAGYVGEIHSEDGAYKVELRGLSDVLRQRVGVTTQRSCRVCVFADLQCKANVSSYTFSRTVTAINQSVTDASPTDVIRINCAGGATGSWVADTDFSGGMTPSTSHAIDLTAVTNPAPQAVYQSCRQTSDAVPFTYTIPGLSPGVTYQVRLHLADFQANTAGQRTFIVLSGSLIMVYLYDIFLESGGKYIAVIPEFYTAANVSGDIVLTWNAGVSNAQVNGIEIMTVSQGSIAGGICIGSDSNPSGYYTYGLVTFTSGLNQGLTFQVANHIAQGGNAYVSFRIPPPFAITPGDTLSIIAGCDRQYQTCAEKFNNSENFHAEPFLPGNDVVMQVGRQNS